MSFPKKKVTSPVVRAAKEKDVFQGMFIQAPEGKIWNFYFSLFSFSLITWTPDIHSHKIHNLVVFIARMNLLMSFSHLVCKVAVNWKSISSSARKVVKYSSRPDSTPFCLCLSLPIRPTQSLSSKEKVKFKGNIFFYISLELSWVFIWRIPHRPQTNRVLKDKVSFLTLDFHFTLKFSSFCLKNHHRICSERECSQKERNLQTNWD